TYGFNGNYNSLTNKPLLFSGSYDDLTDVPVIQGFSGDYNDLTNKPNIKDSIATYGFDGDYDKLTNKPVNVSSFTNDANYATRSEIATIPDGADVGDMLFWESGTKGWNRVPVGTEGQILSIKNGVPTWIDFDASANTYKIGDVYLEDGVAKGIIADISADGSEGLVVSPDEYAGLKWGPNTTLINTGTDGYANTNLIRAAADYNGGAAYLAAFTCVNLGADEWFLPSKEELLKVYANRSFINQRLEAYGKTKLGATASAYWTSSEKDAGNAYLLQFATESTHFAGTVYEVKKDSAIAVRAIRKLTSAEIKSRPDGYKFYKVGDVYYDGRTPVGVVYEISDGGLHGKMVAVEHDLKAWSIAATQIITNAVSNSNGQANLDSIMANVVFDKTFFPDPPDYMIFSACKGEGWYAPAKDEMLAIYNVRASIDVTLNQLKAQGEYIDLLDVSNQDTKIYWTSTEKDLNNAYGISFEDGSVVEKLKNTTGYIRGVRKF
ncbi:MAG: hypothetical protein LBN27_11170, partial [Prevotellaceae bacterium]|nr:hypothetical protein [Prevotellaceae bacterium]